MATATFSRLIDRLRTACRPPEDADAPLLERFRTSRDPVAFERLVEKYGALVWGVCRRGVSRPCDAEDAFQATFLSLVRQIDALDTRRPLGPWLFTVAWRVSRKANSRRPQPPLKIEAGRDAGAEIVSREALRLIDEEIQALPANLREPLILCCLDGRTRDEAAALLDCSPLAVKSRLERARESLRDRLSRRGVELPTAMLLLHLVGIPAKAELIRQSVRLLVTVPASVKSLALGSGLAGGKVLAASLAWAAGALLLGGGIWVASAGENSPRQEPPKPKKVQAEVVPEKETVLKDRFGDPLPEGAVRRFGTIRFRQDNVYHILFTKDSKRIISGTGHSELSVFDAVTGERLRGLSKPSPNNNAGFALSRDGKMLATCGYNLDLWDAETGKHLRDFGYNRCRAVAFSPDGKWVVGAPERLGVIRLFDAVNGGKLREWPVGDGRPDSFEAHDLRFSPDGKTVLASVRQRTEPKPNRYEIKSIGVRLWDPETGTRSSPDLGIPDVPIASFEILPNSNRLAYLRKGELRLVDLKSMKELDPQKLPDSKDKPLHFAFSEDEKRFATMSSKGIVRVVDAESGTELRKFDTSPREGSLALALSPDGKSVASASLYGGESALRVWDVETGKERLADAGPRYPVTLSLSNDGKELVGESRNDPAREYRWSLETGVGSVRPREKTAEAKLDGFISTGRFLYKLDSNADQLEARSLDGKEILGKVKLPAYSRGSAVSPDGKTLAVSFQDRARTVWVWAPETDKAPRVLDGIQVDACQQLLFTHDGKKLITGAGTHSQYKAETLKVWDPATGKEVMKFPSVSAPGKMLLTKDDRFLITGGLWNDGSTVVWDMATGKSVTTLIDPSVNEVTLEVKSNFEQMSAISGLLLSPDEAYLAVMTTVGTTNRLSVYETSTWQRVKSFPVAAGSYPSSMVFGPRCQSVFVSYLDTTALEWDATGLKGKKHPVAGLESLWAELSESASVAFPAMCRMSETEGVVEFLKSKLEPVGKPDPEAVKKSLSRLGSDNFRDREDASRKLIAMQEPLLPTLEEALKMAENEEMKTRLEKVAEAIRGAPTPELRRSLRALMVLKWIGGDEAKAVVDKIAKGEPSARLTRAAK